MRKKGTKIEKQIVFVYLLLYLSSPSEWYIHADYSEDAQNRKNKIPHGNP